MAIPVDPSQLVIHDTSPIVDGSTARESLHRSIEPACLGDRLGYRRYWAAELHGMRGAASCAPAVLAGMVAARTSTIRVGAGGVLLEHPTVRTVGELSDALHRTCMNGRPHRRAQWRLRRIAALRTPDPVQPGYGPSDGGSVDRVAGVMTRRPRLVACGDAPCREEASHAPCGHPR